MTGPHPSVSVVHGDALRVLRSLPDASVDAVVTDPPYAIASTPDVAAPYRLWASEGPVTPAVCDLCQAPAAKGYRACTTCLDELEVEAFAGAGMLGQQSQNWHEKTTHSRGYADTDPKQFGRWCLLWSRECLRVLKPGGHLVAFGGTRTWHRLVVAVEDAGFEVRDSLAWLYATGFPKSLDVRAAVMGHQDRQVPTTELDQARDASTLAGWGTALKPAHEPIVLARKPLAGTVAANVLEFGTGGLNIDGTRLEGGRWPSNALLDSAQAEVLDEQSGVRASRFFWVAKPDPKERVRVAGAAHPTVKPLTLMQELVRLVTPRACLLIEGAIASDG